MSVHIHFRSARLVCNVNYGVASCRLVYSWFDECLCGFDYWNPIYILLITTLLPITAINFKNPFSGIFSQIDLLCRGIQHCCICFFLRNVKVQNVLLLKFYYLGSFFLYTPLLIRNFINAKMTKTYLSVLDYWPKQNKKSRCENFRIFREPTSNYVFGLSFNNDLDTVIDLLSVTCAEDVRARNHFFPRFHLITAAVDARQLGHNC